MRYRSKIKSLIVAPILAGAVGLTTVPGWSEEPTPTPSPRPTPIRHNKSLADVARGLELKKAPAEGEKEEAKKSTSVVITNQTVADNHDKGLITTANPSRNAAPASSRTDTSDQDSKREEWRTKYRDQLQLIDEIEAEIAALDLEIPKLWTDFYSRDDPAYRDGVIKPRLDQALIKRDELEQTLAAEKPKIGKIVKDARKDGALPGWFRDLKK